jgi:hypothetical protein
MKVLHLMVNDGRRRKKKKKKKIRNSKIFLVTEEAKIAHSL